MYNSVLNLQPWHNFILNRSRKLVPIREKFRMIKRYDTGGGKQCPKRLKRRQKCKILKTYSTIINILIEYIQICSNENNLICSSFLGNLPTCKEDCGLGEWGEWSECSQSCGQDGVQVIIYTFLYHYDTNIKIIMDSYSNVLPLSRSISYIIGTITKRWKLLWSRRKTMWTKKRKSHVQSSGLFVTGNIFILCNKIFS